MAGRGTGRHTRAVVWAVLASAVLAVAALGGTGGPVSAQGATTTTGTNVDQTECSGWEDAYRGLTYKVCFRTAGLLHTTQTSSGTFVYVFDGTVTTTVTTTVTSTGALVESGTSVEAMQDRTVTRDGKADVASRNLVATFTLQGRPCTSTVRLQFVNGQFQFYEETFTCG
jgi:hypothetical protein